MSSEEDRLKGYKKLLRQRKVDMLKGKRAYIKNSSKKQKVEKVLDIEQEKRIFEHEV